MAQNRFLDKKWQSAHLKKIKERAGNRYTPELNVDLPIAEIFDGISRTENFYISIRKHYGKFSREFSRVSKKYENNNAQKLYQNLKDEISQLSKILDKIKEYDTKKIPWNKVSRRAEKANKILWELSDQLREEKDKAEKQKTEETDLVHNGDPKVTMLILGPPRAIYSYLHFPIRIFKEFYGDFKG